MTFYEMNQTNISHLENQIIMSAEKGTNLFNAADESSQYHDFPYYYAIISGDFIIQCRISVDFKELYDLGSLVIYENKDKWIKFAFENSDVGKPAVVSVVTNHTSDDCNNQIISETHLWLQICRKGNIFALHYSNNKINWKLARICKLEMAETVKVGISTQCPLGNRCIAYYTDLEITDNPYKDIRYLKK